MLVLESLDGLSDYEETITCNRDSNPIDLEVHSRRLWKCVVLAYGCRNHSVLVDDHELSEKLLDMHAEYVNSWAYYMYIMIIYSGTPLYQTPSGPVQVSGLARCPLFRGY